MGRKYELPKLPRNVEIIRVLEEGKAYLINHLPTPAQCALWSKEVDGYIYRSDRCVTHSSGNRAENFLAQYVDNWDGTRLDVLADLEHNRAIAFGLTGCEKRGWTYSSLAHQMVKWIGLPQRLQHNKNAFLPAWHFQMCKPGTYGNGPISLWDMSGAYWHIASRLPSPRVEGMVLDGGKVQVVESEQPGDALSEARWWEFMAQDWTKSFKVRFIGCNAAGWALDEGVHVRPVRWHKGEAEAIPDMPGPLQALSLVCVRICYELCQMAAMEPGYYDDDDGQALYANADCVAYYDWNEEPPEIWQRLEIPCKLKARGEPAEFYYMGCWRIGDTMTGHMANDMRCGFGPSGTDEEYIAPLLVEPSAYHILLTGTEEQWRRKKVALLRQNLSQLTEDALTGRSGSPGSGTSSAPPAGPVPTHQVILHRGIEP